MHAVELGRLFYAKVSPIIVRHSTIVKEDKEGKISSLFVNISKCIRIVVWLNIRYQMFVNNMIWAILFAYLTAKPII